MYDKLYMYVVKNLNSRISQLNNGTAQEICKL